MISFENYDHIKDFVTQSNCKIIDLKFIDLAGTWRHITIPERALNESTLKIGYGIDGSSVFSSKKVTKGDMNIIPDISAGFLDPFWDDNCLSFICNLIEINSNKDSDFDPRAIARRAQKFLAEQSFADMAQFLPELEYYIFDEVKWHNSDNSAGFHLGSNQSSPPTMIKDPDSLIRSRIGHQAGYLVAPPLDSNFRLRQLICDTLEGLGIEVKYHHHEVGNCSQEEIEFEFMPFLKACDSVSLAKYLIKNLAIENGMIATFMPKPIANHAGNGMHMHIYLSKNNQPVFWSDEGYSNLSDIALQFMAGIMYHGRAIMAFTSATVNSYRRLKPGFETPTSFFFSEANREAALRIPGYANTPETKRFEYRPSDATGNIYLSASAIIMAGIDGVKQKLNPTELGFGPFDSSGPKMTFNTENKRLFVPQTLEEALYALNEDMDFLVSGDVFSRSFIESYIEHKWDKEVLEIWGRPHPYEFDLYFNL